MLVRVGTRGSRLSLIQTDMILDRIRKLDPSLKVERRIITTSGDIDRTTPLFSLGQKGIFEKEVDQAVVDGQMDFAVHSMKDVPTPLNKELTIACVPERGAVADVLVSQNRIPLEVIPNGKVVGTSSLLRTAELRRFRPGVRVSPIRGNVDTRVGKVEKGDYDAVILAEAGVARLGMMDRVTERLSVEDFIPAPGQGALALITRRDDSKMIQILKTIENPPARAETEAERKLVQVLEGGCKVPVGALARANHEILDLTASIFSLDGRERLVAKVTGPVKDAASIGKAVGAELIAKGAKKIEETWRTIYS